LNPLAWGPGNATAHEPQIQESMAQRPLRRRGARKGCQWKCHYTSYWSRV